MKKLLFLVLALGLMVGQAHAVDLATAFGASASFTKVDPQHCYLKAVHSGVTTQGSVGITANGSDSAVISLVCNNVSITQTIPTITVNTTVVNNVAFPQTVTSSSPGIWSVVIGSLSPFTIYAQ